MSDESKARLETFFGELLKKIKVPSGMAIEMHSGGKLPTDNWKGEITCGSAYAHGLAGACYPNRVLILESFVAACMADKTGRLAEWLVAKLQLGLGQDLDATVQFVLMS